MAPIISNVSLSRAPGGVLDSHTDCYASVRIRSFNSFVKRA